MSSGEKSVIISLWSAGSCGRKQLAGILRYVNAGHPWHVRIIMDPNAFTVETIESAERNGVDGFIAFAGPAAAERLAKSSVPTVLLSFPTPALRRRKKNIVINLNDNEQIGRMGAEYLMSCGMFGSYGFVPDTEGRGWSVQREKSFCARLRSAGTTAAVYDPSCGDLADWLRALPKPAAVMAPFDFRARDVLEACRYAKLHVPKDVSVIGVDDDELVCDVSHPTITSIGIDQDEIGYIAAATLDRLMSSKSPVKAETIIHPCQGVTERESTRPLPPTVPLARRITAFIDEHYREPISVSDIATRLGISRRLADLRYTEQTGETIRTALENRRLQEIKRHLENSTLPISKITRLCGLENDLWIKYVFKRRFGMTMSEWRAKSRR